MEKNIRISLTGDIGSGKTSVAKKLVEHYNLELISIGKLQRQMAEEMNIKFSAFNSYMEKHPECDKILDDKQRQYDGVEGNFLFDSRLAWHFVPSTFKVYMSVSPEIAAKRILEDKRKEELYENEEEAVKMIAERRKSEKNRFSEFYGVDITDMSNYDLIVNTDNLTADQVAEVIIKHFDSIK